MKVIIDKNLKLLDGNKLHSIYDIAEEIAEEYNMDIGNAVELDIPEAVYLDILNGLDEFVRVQRILKQLYDEAVLDANYIALAASENEEDRAIRNTVRIRNINRLGGK